MARNRLSHRPATLEERTFFEVLVGLRAAYGHRDGADAESVISIARVIASANAALARTASSPPAATTT